VVGKKATPEDDDEDLAFEPKPDLELERIATGPKEEQKIVIGPDDPSRKYLIYNKDAFFSKDSVSECLDNAKEDYLRPKIKHLQKDDGNFRDSRGQ
jgi:hypothetical protein